MPDFSRVKEESPQEYFKVIHRVLRVPNDLYYDVVRERDDTHSEQAVQQFISEYLDWKEPYAKGIIGMVRGEVEEGCIVLDAAVRYPLHERRH